MSEEKKPSPSTNNLLLSLRKSEQLLGTRRYKRHWLLTREQKYGIHIQCGFSKFFLGALVLDPTNKHVLVIEANCIKKFLDSTIC